MSENPDPVIGWVLGELRKAANEGISLQELSNSIDKSGSFVPDSDAKNAAWKHLTARNDFSFVDETKAPFKALSLTDLLGVGQGDLRIRLAEQNEQEVAAEGESLVASIESDPQATQQPESPPKPAPKRRGRPPKKKRNVAIPAPSSAQEQPGIATTLATPSSSTRHQVKAVFPPRKLTDPPNSEESDAIAVESTQDAGILPAAQASEHTLNSVILVTTSDLPAIIPVSNESELPSAVDETSKDTADEESRNDHTENAASTTPRLSSRLQSTGAPHQTSRLDTPLPEAITQPSSPNGPDIPVDTGKANTQRRSSSRVSGAELLPEAVFKSQDDMDWENGKEGVYIAPPGVKVKKRPGVKKKKHSLLIVFRSTKLKDPQRLANGKDTWRERIMPVVAQARVADAEVAAENGLIPRSTKKRKAETQPDLTPKPKATRKKSNGKAIVGPVIEQGWGEEYPENEDDRDQSAISILEADSPPEPTDPNGWSSSWTQGAIEEPGVNGDHQNSNAEARGSSSVPSNLQTATGSPPNSKDAPISQTVADISTPANEETHSMSQPASSISSLHDCPLEPEDSISHKPSNLAATKIIGHAILHPSPVSSYKSPYAPATSSSAVEDLSKASSRPYSSPYAGNSSAAPSEAVSSLQTPIGSTSNVSKLNLPGNNAGSYRSPYSVPLPASRSEVKRQSVTAQHIDTNSTIHPSSHISDLASLTNTDAPPPSMNVAASEEIQGIREDAHQSELPTATTGMTPTQHFTGPGVSPTQIDDFLTFMDKTLDTSTNNLDVPSTDLATPSAGSRGRGRGQGRGRGRGTRGSQGTRGRGRSRGRGRGVNLADVAPLVASSQGEIQADDPINPIVTDSVTGDGRISRSPEAHVHGMSLPSLQEQDSPENDAVVGASAGLLTATPNGPSLVIPRNLSHAPVDPSIEGAPIISGEIPAASFSGINHPKNGEPAEVLTTIHDTDYTTLHQTPDPESGAADDPGPNVLETPQKDTSDPTPSAKKTGRGSRGGKSKLKAPAAPKSTPPPKTPRVRARADPEEKLRLRIAEAEIVEVPEGVVRFSCLYKDNVGNMFLSQDQSMLEFFALSQHPPETPMISMRTSKIIGNPIMSTKGSFPMELHVKSSNDENKKKGYRFTYAASGSGFEAAQEMRNKIVAAMIASEFTAGEFATVAEAQAAKVRPYLCELCGERFKNPNGLEYHLTKAKTKCNPNWVPEADTGKRVYRKKKESLARATSQEGTPRTPRKTKTTVTKNDVIPGDDELGGSTTSEDEPVLIPRSQRKVIVNRIYDSDGSEAPRPVRSARKPRVIEDDEADAEGDSDDSIFNWARNNATNGYDKTRRSETPRPPRSAKKSKPRRLVQEEPEEDSDASLVEWFQKNGKIGSVGPEAPAPGKIYKALSREAEVAGQIVKEFADRIQNGEEEIFGVAIFPTSQLTTAKDIATAMVCRELKAEWYEELVVNLVERNEGMFPAERSVWLASVAIWLKQQPLATVLPEAKLCAKAVDDLLESKKFTQDTFVFKDRARKPRAVTRSILTINGLDMRTDRADLLKELIKEMHPKAYVPSQLAPPPSVLDKMQAVIARLLPSLAGTATQVEESEEELEPLPVLEFSDDSDEDNFVEDPEAMDVDSENSDSDKDLEDEDDAASLLSGPNRSKKRDRTSSGGGKRKRHAGHNAKISEAIKRRFDAIRAGGENPYPWNFKAKGNRIRNRKVAPKAATTQQLCWGEAAVFMPNSDTGAWDQGPASMPGALFSGQSITIVKSVNSRVKLHYFKRPQLPEPITFMQAPDGAWSVRPFGHGVKPIFSRPARRAEGNPNLQVYLDRVENGHRPIMYPPPHNRVNLPSVPSKRLLEAMRAGNPMDEATGLPIIDRFGDNKRKASTISFEDEHEPVTKRNRREASVRFDTGDNTNEDGIIPKISRATGKPVRIYNRGFPKQIFLSDEHDPRAADGSWNLNPSRRAGRRSRFSEVDILNFYEPKKLTQDAPRNPGLTSLPAGYGLHAPTAKGSFNYSPDYSNVAFMTPVPIKDGQEPGLSSWTVARLDTYRPVDYDLRWDGATAFTVEDIPYSELREDDQGGLILQSKAKVVVADSDAEVVEEPKLKRHRKRLKSRDDRQQKWTYVRQHTALPQDFDDIFNDPVEAGKYFGVEIGVGNEMGAKRARNFGSNVMLPETESRFIVSCLVLRTLTGGLDLQVDWVLVADLFPDYSLNFLKRLWMGINARKKVVLAKLEADFREKFLAAYQTGEVPRIDYDHLTEYPWSDLIDWALANTEASLSSKAIMLPSTREDLAEEYELREPKEEGFHWRDTYFSTTTAVYKRIMSTAAISHSVALQARKRRSSEDIDEFTVAKSWIRVAANTPDEDWNAPIAKTKMSTFKKSLLSDVLDSLVAQKVVKKRAINKTKNGRIYEMNDSWGHTLRRHIKEEMFVQAVTYKRWLDAQFRSGVPCIKADYFVNEGTTMCLSSLQAHGRIRFHGADIPMNKFGLGDGGYETKKIPKERLRFNIDIYPTESYIYDDANPVLSNIMFQDPPRGGEDGEIPIWYGVAEKPVLGTWYRVLGAISQVVALRAGINIEGLRDSFRSTLEPWEWKLLLNWGAEVGVFHRLGEGLGDSEGWTTGEWWWVVVGSGLIDCGVGVGGEGQAVMGGADTVA